MKNGYPCLRVIQNYKYLNEYLKYIEKVCVLDILNTPTIDRLKNSNR